MNDNNNEILDVNINQDNSVVNQALNNTGFDNNINNQKPKKSKKGLIVIILLLLIIAGLCTFIYLKKDVLFNSGNTNANQNSNTNENNNSNSNENNIVEFSEEELTDASLLKIITDKAEMIVSPSFISNFYIKGDYFDNLYKNTELTESNKILLVLEKQKGSSINIDVETMSNNEFKKLYNQEWPNESVRDEAMKQYGLSGINNDYRYLFGTNISSYMDIESCPSYYYDSVNKVYFSYSQCGGLDGVSILTYINRLSTKGNDIYVYVSIGKMSIIEDSSPYKYNIYSDYGEKNKLQEINGDDSLSFKIDSSNYEKFSEYKLTFTKDGNDYYYKSIERTK